MSEFSKRLCFLLDKANMRPSDLSEKTGIGKSAISQYMSGSFKPKQVRTEQIANALGVSVAYLMGIDDRITDNSEESMLESPCYEYQIIGTVAAGFGCEAIEEYTGDCEQIPAEWLRGYNKEDFFVLKVRGDSMYPQFIDGDRVLVFRTESVYSGTIAVILYDNDQATLKKVKYKNGEDWLELIPINPEYTTKRIEGEELEQCRILGEVKRLIRLIK